jgi:acetate kinase
MRVLVLNSGSSSIKFRLADVVGHPDTGLVVRPALVHGTVKNIGKTAVLEVRTSGTGSLTASLSVSNHYDAVRLMFEHLSSFLHAIEAVGHRVVHGGDRFVESTVVTKEVEAEIAALAELAPLHNPPCLAGIQGARAVLGPRVPMVAVFDTAFHQTMPEVAKRYALPMRLADRHGVRRYGFHGIAHASLVGGYAEATGRPLNDSRLITLQLGNGCSMAAIASGKSVETSMGFTPLEGLVMGTRSGDVDPSVVRYLSQREQVEPAEVERWLNERSGLLGLSGRSNDMRELLRAADQEGDQNAQLAIEVFCYRARKYLGAYLAVLGGADAVIFGGGIGENAPEIRARICRGMEWCGLRMDEARNRAAVGLAAGQAARVSADGAGLDIYVVAADEETWIARETARCVWYG